MCVGKPDAYKPCMTTPLIFDRTALRHQRDRRAKQFDDADFLIREVSERLFDRVLDIPRRFPLALDIGCHAGALGALALDSPVETLVQMDISPNFAGRAAFENKTALTLCGDEEALPVTPGIFDLAMSCLSLHWVNDLPGALIQIKRALKPDGLFLGAIFGGDTLRELRAALLEAEIDILGGASPRVSPFADIRDAAGLMQRAGFALPVVDQETIEVTYETAFALMQDIRLMGEAGIVLERRKSFTPRSVFLRAAEIYAERHSNAEGRISARFDILFLHGWAPHDTQQQPLKRGSAQTRLADALEATEHSAGEKAGK